MFTVEYIQQVQLYLWSLCFACTRRRINTDSLLACKHFLSSLPHHIRFVLSSLFSLAKDRTKTFMLVDDHGKRLSFLMISIFTANTTSTFTLSPLSARWKYKVLHHHHGQVREWGPSVHRNWWWQKDNLCLEVMWVSEEKEKWNGLRISKMTKNPRLTIYNSNKIHSTKPKTYYYNTYYAYTRTDIIWCAGAF